jgi:hypothetical protein
MVQALEKITWTIYDLEVLPENPAIRYELIAGDLLVTRTPWHWFSLIVVLKTLPDKGLTENTKLKKLFPS